MVLTGLGHRVLVVPLKEVRAGTHRRREAFAVQPQVVADVHDVLPGAPGKVAVTRGGVQAGQSRALGAGQAGDLGRHIGLGRRP